MRLTSVPRVLVPSTVCAAVLLGTIGPAAALGSAQDPPDTTVLGRQAAMPQGTATDRAAADTTEDTLADLQKAIDDLVAAITSGGSPTDAVPALLTTVTGVVNSILSSALGGLPALPSPASLPALPAFPAFPELPTFPEFPELPELPEFPEFPTLPPPPELPPITFPATLAP